MLTRLLFAALLPAMLAASGCAAHRDPIIDRKGVDPDRLARDWQECEAYSKEIVIGEGIARGSATGAAVGAAAGAIGSTAGGDVGESAAYGALYGGTRSGLDADREQQKVFKRCLSGRGYRVLN